MKKQEQGRLSFRWRLAQGVAAGLLALPLGALAQQAFTRAGVSGCLRVEGDRFVLDAKLGFLLGAFKDRIEAEIVKNLDTLLAAKKPAAKKTAAKKKAT